MSININQLSPQQITTPSSTTRPQNKLQAAVIGSGFGGLAAAIRLQNAGFQVSLFEKRDLPGGRAYVYKDQGFTFDAGPTVITAPECLEELFNLSQKNMSDYVDLMPVTPFYRLFWEDGTVFNYSQSIEETLQQIRQLSPQDEHGYLKFLKYSEEVFHQGYTELAHQPFLDWWSMIKVSPQLLKLKAYKNVYAQLSSFIKEPHLREAFSFHSLLVGGNPFSTSSIYTLIHYLERKWGVFFPRGGTGALVQGLVKLFTDLGGKVYLNSPVQEIITEENEVKGIILKNGERFKFDCVVSNADIVHTYQKLLRNNPEAQKETKKLLNKNYSMSLFLIYFGTKKTYPQLAHHNVLFGPRYKGLLKDIFKNGYLPEDFSLYLHAPTRSDASLAPEGCECFYVLSPVAHLGKMPIDWTVEGPKYADKILNYLDQRYIPGLKENLVTQRIFTPLDFEKELNAYHGAAFSLEPLLTQSAYFRQHNRDDHIKGLYFVGAGTHPGAGLPGVINSAKATHKVVLEDMNERLIQQKFYYHQNEQLNEQHQTEELIKSV